MAVLTVFVEAMCVGFEISSAQPGHGTATFNEPIQPLPELTETAPLSYVTIRRFLLDPHPATVPQTHVHPHLCLLPCIFESPVPHCSRLPCTGTEEIRGIENA